MTRVVLVRVDVLHHADADEPVANGGLRCVRKAFNLQYFCVGNIANTCLRLIFEVRHGIQPDRLLCWAENTFG